MKSSMLRKLFREKDLIEIAGAHDGLTSKLVENSGFDGVWASGFEISTSYAVPDANILTMTQFLERACEMNNATRIPVVADCDTGFGNSNNVIYMVRQYESSGIAAVCIEDKKFPKVNSLLEGGRQELAPMSEFVGKIMAAKNTQVTKDFMVIARIEALIAGWGIEEALKRADAYVEAGADAILVHSKSRTPDEIVKFCKKWKNPKKVPIVVIPTNFPSFTRKDMVKNGIKMAIYANHGIRSAIMAVSGTLGEIRKSGGLATVDSKLIGMKTVFDLQGMPDIEKFEKQYLKADEKVRAVILAAGRPAVQENMKDVVKGIPLAMLDVNGKSLLQLDVDTLRKAGADDVSVVVGYEKEKVAVDGANIIVNDGYDRTHVLESLMKARDVLSDRVIVAYGDILFDDFLIERLIKTDSDIVLVVDPAFKELNVRNKKLDLVKTKYKPMRSGRHLRYESNPITGIGKDIKESEADYEFIGIVLFSKKGAEAFKKAYDASKRKYKVKQFHSASCFEKANITDLFTEMLENGYRLDSLETRSGWIEVHNFENYRNACKVLKKTK